MNENLNSIHDLLRKNRQQYFKSLSLEAAKQGKKEAKNTATAPKTTMDKKKTEASEAPLVYPKKEAAAEQEASRTKENLDAISKLAAASVAKFVYYLSEANKVLAIKAKSSAGLISKAFRHISASIHSSAKKTNAVVGKWLDRHVYYHIDSILNG